MSVINYIILLLSLHTRDPHQAPLRVVSVVLRAWFEAGILVKCQLLAEVELLLLGVEL